MVLLSSLPFVKKNDEGLGANPTDRGRSGSKIHLHVDQNGMPLGVHVVGANIHDSRLVGATLVHSFLDYESQGIGSSPDNLCLDKGYDFERVDLEVREHGLQPHIRSRGEEVAEKSHPARRWVVERTFAWLKGFRAIRTRYCQRLCNYLAMVHFACAIILLRRIVASLQ
jgi:putative transposase